ncbi:hypothetical protein AVEN_105790-1 [Araneus ventricosus]|uniref:Uncharacterized protein n=1 Tax=Araneus ventricosus TaxID=182803 RepID=A0A4Y2W6I6_ARAVE|nr:hypothetical protein AVEN_193056-1 [Araneus ventricosus]GBO31577.1 hypothetical protein AVEN_105790-1 [Araneus ventricosus]
MRNIPFHFASGTHAPKAYMEGATNKAQTTSIDLSQLMARMSKLAIKHKLLRYKSIIRSASSSWLPHLEISTATKLKKLQVFQNQQLMRFVNAYGMPDIRSCITNYLKAKSILDHTKDISSKFFQRLSQIPNELLRNNIFSS